MDKYHHILHQSNTQLLKKQRQLNVIVAFRLFTFLIAVFAVYKLVAFGGDSTFTVLLITSILAFFVVIIVDTNVSNQKKKLQSKKLICENQIALAKGNKVNRDDGSDDLDPGHPYSFDLDLFGVKSLFYYLNNTCTVIGKETLLTWFKKIDYSAGEIESRQKAIIELSNNIDWCIDFMSEGSLVCDSKAEKDQLQRWNTAFDYPLKNNTIRLCALFVFVNLACIAGKVFFDIPLYVLLAFTIVEHLILRVRPKTIYRIQAEASKQNEILSKYLQLIQAIEDSHFESDKLAKLKEGLVSNKGVKASEKIRRLKKHIDALESGRYFILGQLLNIFFFWNLFYFHKILQWEKENKKELIKWIEIIGEYDSLASIAIYSFNNKDFIFPTLERDDLILNIEQGAHPLIGKESRIYNDFLLNDKNRFCIITGANMAGKSTFLRTVGTNIVLAKMGAPVCAKAMSVSAAMLLYSNMCTTDSLNKGESYFFAELSKLKSIMEAVALNTPCIVLLDEPLRGTNSKDKLLGSTLFIKKLLSLNTHVMGLVATHDLQLTNLAEENSSSIFNMCFDVETMNDEMTFDYKLKEGITKNMNAVQLMTKMKII